jgi:hypothetical protein
VRISRSQIVPPDWIDYCSTAEHIYFLLTDCIQILDYSGNQTRTIPLEQPEIQPTSIFIDEYCLLVGYVNGTMEMRLIEEDLQLLRVSDTADAGGPGKKSITSIGSSPEYVLVHASENGLMIYTKPSMLFYKWIMLGGHCTIDSFAIRDSIMFVLRDTHEIHLQDFDKHRIFEQYVKTYDYIDIEYDGSYLYAATTSSILVYLPEEAERPHNPKLVGQLNFKRKLEGLIMVENRLHAVFPDEIVPVNVDSSSVEKPVLETGDGLQMTGGLELKYENRLRPENFVGEIDIPHVADRTLNIIHFDTR